MALQHGRRHDQASPIHPHAGCIFGDSVNLQLQETTADAESREWHVCLTIAPDLLPISLALQTDLYLFLDGSDTSMLYSTARCIVV